MLRDRKSRRSSKRVFPGKAPDIPVLGRSLDHQHALVREALKLPKEFVLHSLRQTMLSRLGEAGADVFTVMRIARHRSVTVSQKYVHATPEALEQAFEKQRDLNTIRAAWNTRRQRQAGAVKA